MTNIELYEIAKKTLNPMFIGKHGKSGQVACALLTKKGNVYTGVSLDLSCSLGMCAEQSAMAEMVKNGETEIEKIIAVHENNIIYPPCGRCREFIIDINYLNKNTIVLLKDLKEVTLDSLLPNTWLDAKKEYELNK